MPEYVESDTEVILNATSSTRGRISLRIAGVEKAAINADGTGSGAFTGGTGGSSAALATFVQAGALSAGSGVTRFLLPGAGTITGVVAAVATAPTGQSIKVDVNKNGTTIFTTQANRPTIAISANATTTEPTPDVTTFAAGDYLTVDIDQVGSGAAGSDLVVQIVYTLS